MDVGAKVIVIGIGNLARGDDAAGRNVAKLLACSGGARVTECEGDAAELLEIWRGADACVIIDAVSAGERAGFIHRLSVKESTVLPASHTCCSSHAFGLAEAIAFGRIFNQLPPELIVYGIEAGTFAIGAPLSSAVEKAIPIVAERVREDLRQFQEIPG
jgi:hydrogenase maturation protease